MSARKISKAAKHGELDGACGFYAITNALHLLEPELEKSDVFKCVWESFLKDGNPMCIIKGTTRGSLKNILSRTIDAIHAGYELFDEEGKPYSFGISIPFWHHGKERDRNDVMNEIGQADFRNGSVVIIGYQYASLPQGEDECNHWTVIREIKEDCLITHDSSYESKRIPLSAIRVDSFSQSYHSARPYNIYSQDVFVIKKIN